VDKRLLSKSTRFCFWAILVCSLWVSLVVPTPAAADAQISLDVRQAGHIISPGLFGDWFEWDYFGQNSIQVADWVVNTGTVRSDLIAQLKPSGVTVLRYPGGTLSDLFHWSGAIGPWAGRTLQMTTDADASATPPFQKQQPVFGPDEFAQVAQTMGSDIMITANVGTGTSSEAAGWLTHYQSLGVHPAYWEVGNENYLDMGDAISAITYRPAATYAGIFDDFASQLRALDPNAKVGIVGYHNNTPQGSVYNQIVLSNLHQRADFLAVHNCYYPMAWIGYNGIGADDAYRALLASSLDIQTNFDLLETDITQYAGATSPNLALAVTEHSSFWLSPSGVSDPSTLMSYLGENQTLGSALFSALTYQVFFSRPRIQIANHTNMISPYFQSLLTMAVPDTSHMPASYPAGYQPNAVPSAFYHVFRLYRQAAGGAYIPVTVTGAPTFDSVAFQFTSAHSQVPCLDAVAVRAASPGNRVLLYVVNRDLTRTVTTQVQITGWTQPLSALSAQTVNAANLRDKNSAAQPSAIQIQTQALTPQSTFAYVFPAHSLTCFTADEATPEPTSQPTPASTTTGLIIAPNPFHPGSQVAIRFGHLASGGQLRIYNVTGERIAAMRADTQGNAAWDGMNTSSRPTAAGVYFVIGDGPSGKVKGKFAIQP
jgi:alpha-L-arabinofuranosidase